jgi:acyl-CoA synthetase (AMP-forming)/AMP-acid ligase II
MNPQTVIDVLARGRDEAPAIGAPGRPDLTYAGLRAQVAETVAALNGAGIGRNDRVAIVLPNGPDMATAFLGVAAGATSAPLNPSYRAEEFSFYLSDLRAKALIVEAGSASPAIEVAEKLGVRVLTLAPMPAQGAGRFTLRAGLSPARPAAAAGRSAPLSALRGTADGAREGGKLPSPAEGVTLDNPAEAGPHAENPPRTEAGCHAEDSPPRTGYAEPADIALVLHTSGTTSRPKIVPLSQQNICATARNVARTVRFTAADRGLNVMPLFHIHGLMAGLLAPLSAGSFVFCSPGFNALRFFAWMAECRPTWYTAVPTMHQAILARARQNAEIIEANPLRFVRSSSSSLPPQVIAELEATFRAPVIEAYGMTEAAHQMASNPLPPGVRKPGTVGPAAGPEVAVMDEAGALLAPGATGEIVIRGENVTPGYENNPRANAEAFTSGWFRTGDQGVMDADGYVSITGRLKEIINRGGEKISPREVDEVIMDHPAVQQVVTFGIPHEKLDEEVGAAIVLREGKTATEKEIREFCAARLADFKVPRRVVFLAEIPKGATGKLQRIGLAKKLGLG